MVVGVCRVTLLIPESHSLKEKRRVLRRIKDLVSNKFNCAIAEVGDADDQDAWQSAQLGFAVVSNDHGFSQSMVQKVLAFMEDLAIAKITDDEQDFVSYGEELDSSGGPSHWEPEK
jgi:uncharacterized protein YlxP (DUF503 family)